MVTPHERGYRMIDLRENAVDSEVFRWTGRGWKSVGVVRYRPLNPKPFGERVTSEPMRFRFRGEWFGV